MLCSASVYPPLRLKRGSFGESANLPSPASRTTENNQGGYIYLCRQCHTHITGQAQEIKINSRHVHIFPNPHGLVFEIGCFSEALCMSVGQPTLEFTWFPGFAWSIVICVSCRRHLGWLYTKGDSHFYGLILDSLIKQESEE